MVKMPMKTIFAVETVAPESVLGVVVVEGVVVVDVVVVSGAGAGGVVVAGGDQGDQGFSVNSGSVSESPEPEPS